MEEIKTAKNKQECVKDCVLRKTDVIIKHKIKVNRIYYSCSPHALVDLQSLLKNRNLLSCCFITLATSPPCQQLHRRQQSKQQHRDSSGLDPELSSCPLENDETRSIYWCHYASWHLQRKMGNCSWLILCYTENASMCLHPFLRDDGFVSINIIQPAQRQELANAVGQVC